MLDAADLAWKLAGSVPGWAPPGLLDTYSDERRAAAERTLLHTGATGGAAPQVRCGVPRKARPVLLDLADHADLRELAGERGGRVDVSATIDERPADALLIRPDALIAWAAATVDEPGETGLPALREALTTRFGPPST